MGIEIERKFLVNLIPDGMEGAYIRQGYLQSEIKRAVRIRIIENNKVKKGILTIKGVGNKIGMSRYEFETEIPIPDADHLFTLCDKPIIEKRRFKYEYFGIIWEIDEFLGLNKGLVVAEVELKSEDQLVNKPDFVGKEITGKEKYYNLMLLKRPFSTW